MLKMNRLRMFFSFMRRDNAKKHGKCCINQSIARDKNLIEYITL